ncbi:hypothetical protein Mal52_37070 [Symmachiella dynata]|uniref:Uncharacterized protein n=2 Tax=Symmachiella dynata TaxID=2527995 RepID=A0A517ZRV0_9PLAN|nr:hypothetical protein Mal52_37070 [Symmachiella dynata]
MNRPLSLVLFIEEPEVHLHAQAQQAFIANAWGIIEDASKRHGEVGMAPQLVVTTHSSHILDTVDFANVRYFRRRLCEGDDPTNTITLNASDVLSLRGFRPTQNTAGKNEIATPAQVKAKKEMDDEYERVTLDFLKRYLKLTHCDLFFADAAVLVEGAVEKILLPEMIKKTAPGLRQRYLTVLEVGGAYAHRFASLLEFLAVPYLVITDIDSVAQKDGAKRASTCRADTMDAVSSNGSLKYFLELSTIKDLIGLKCDSQLLQDRRCYIAYQRPSLVDGYTEEQPMHGRTLEETFAYENLPLFRNGSLKIAKDLPAELDHEKEYDAVFKAVKSSTFKKTEFALMVASSGAEWATPKYIADGLRWLEGELQAAEPSGQEGAE